MFQWLVQKVLVSKGQKHCDYSFAIKLFREKWESFEFHLFILCYLGYLLLFGLSFEKSNQEKGKDTSFQECQNADPASLNLGLKTQGGP